MQTILVIDEIEFSRVVICKMLSGGGYQVIEAATGTEGWKLIKERNPDLILIDLLMPEMDGLETIRKLSTFKPELPIIALAVSTDYDLFETALSLGAKSTLGRPFKQFELLEVVQNVLEDSALSGEEFSHFLN